MSTAIPDCVLCTAASFLVLTAEVKDFLNRFNRENPWPEKERPRLAGGSESGSGVFLRGA